MGKNSQREHVFRKRDASPREGLKMTTVQGDFTNSDRAGEAKAALMQKGIAVNHIRVWNIIPDSNAGEDGGNATTTGAVLGGVLGGGAGLVAGAAIGATLDGGSDIHLPAPSGVRVVVDASGNEAQIEISLRASGAANVHSSNGTG